MLKELNLTTLEEKQKQQRLIFFYKVAEGQIPAMPSSDFITRNEGKRQIRPKKFDNCISTNIVTKQSRINSKSIKIPEAKSEQYNNSFFVRTAIDWNNLEDNIVQSKQLKTSKQQFLAVSKTKSALSLPVVLKSSRDSTTYSYRRSFQLALLLTFRSSLLFSFTVILFNSLC